MRVEASSPPKQRSFDAARADVLQEWRQERRSDAQDRYFADLLKKYDVVVAETVKPLLAPVAGAAK